MGAQVYIILGFVVLLGLGVGKVYTAGAVAAENANRLAAAEALRKATHRAMERAVVERKGREQAENTARAAEDRGEHLAAAVERLKDTEQCPAKCFSFRWQSQSR